MSNTMIDEHTLSRIEMAKRYAKLYPSKAKSILGPEPIEESEQPKEIEKNEVKVKHGSPKDIIKNKQSGKKYVPYTADDKLTEELLAAIADACMCSLEELRGRRQDVGVPIARSIFCYVERKLNKRSYPDLGKLINKHYTTIMSSVKNFKREYVNKKIFEVYMKNDKLRELVEKAMRAA